MKRVISVLLVVTVLLALSASAFAAGSPTGTGKKSPAMNGVSVYNSNDKRLAIVPTKSITKCNVRQADKLDDADKEAFLKAYEEAKNIEGKVVLQVLWLDIADEYKNMDDFSYARYYFTTPGRNVELSVNGKDMEIVRLGNGQYYAKLTEFGTVVITRT